MDRRQVSDFVTRHGWLSQTPAHFQEQLLARCDLVTVKLGGAVYQDGDEAASLFAIVEGRIDMHVPVHDEHPTLAYICGPGYWVGDGAVAQRTRLMAMVASPGCQMLRLSRVDMQRL